VIITNSHGKIDWVNKAFEQMTGYDLSEVKGKIPGTFLQGKETNMETVAYMRQQIRNLKPFTCEVLNYRKTGEEYWLRINAQPIFDKKGNVTNFFAIEDDITEKINADKKLDELRNFYEKILDNIPSDIAVFDREHHYLYVNSMGIKDAKLRKWIIGKKDEDYIKERNKPISLLEGRRKLFDSIMKSKVLKTWEEELKQPDGTSKYVLRNMYPVINNDYDVDLVIGYGVDITNIKNIQQQIEESEKRYREIIDNSLAIITTHDLEGKFIDSNPMIGKVFGYSDVEFIGHPLTDFMLEEDKLLFDEAYLNKIKISKEATGIFRVVHKNGHIVYTLYNNYLKEELGKDPYVIGFAVDITKRILAEKELKKEKKISEELAMAKHNFLANMSHEIRTPMNAIMGMSRQLLKSNLNDEQRSYLGNITNASENLLVIINDVLDLAKLEAGKLSFEKTPFESKQILENFMKVMLHKAEEKGLLLTNSYCDMRLSPILIGDPFRINQIMLNLVSNAIKFTTIGSVDVCLNVLKDYDTSQEIELMVRDTGIGMEQSFLKDLFKKFSQEYESTSRKFGGTGLGMGITKNLIDKYGR
jgi:PAS domain S-box-containing protein